MHFTITPSETTLYCERKSYFLDALEAGSNKEAVDYCMSIALDVKKKVPHKYNCNNSQLCDSKFKKKMQTNANDLKVLQPRLTLYGCSACWLNFLGKDITLPQVISHVD